MMVSRYVFTGCAFRDKNANGLVDSEDALIGGIRFIVTLSHGAGFGEKRRIKMAAR